ncbi:transposase, partial [Mycobacterium angelicum]
MRTAALPDPVVAAAVAVRRRGKSKTANWRRPEQVAVIALELDLSGDAVMRRRVEKHWDAVFRLRRAVQRGAGAASRAYLAARHERAGDPQAVRHRLGLSRKAIEDRAKVHVERAGWMRAHLTKATALHVADEVWQSCDRFLFCDSRRRRHRPPRVGSWWDFTRIPGRARSHTKTQPVWETYRLVGSLQGHLDTYGQRATIAAAGAVESGRSVLAQPKRLPAPAGNRRSWWDYDGPLAVVYTGLPGGDLVMPVRLAQGAGQFGRLAHFLADPARWHKIDLCRVRDRRAPGGGRYQAHLTILGPGWVGPTTAQLRQFAPTGRIGGGDGNVSNIAVASIDTHGERPAVLTSHVTATPDQQQITVREAKKARDRMRALDRSRRATNASQYRLSPNQQARADRRAAAGLPTRTVDTPAGARVATSAGNPVQAYRKDVVSHAYRDLRADHAAAASATTRRKDAFARQTAQAIVAAHGPHLITEDVDVRTWARRWGRGVAAFTPGRMLSRLAGECTATGGTLLTASTFTT